MFHIRRNSHRLDQELVLALRVGSRFILQSLQQDYPILSALFHTYRQSGGERTLDLDSPAGLDTAGVRAHTVAERKLEIKNGETARSI